MKTKALLLIVSFSVLFSSSLFAENEETSKGLTIERSISNPAEFQFPNDEQIFPDKSDFSIKNYILLSNEEGDRWVTVTLKNNSSGNRIFDNDQIMALFANGKRLQPQKKTLRFEGKETQTFAINFGRSKFPILAVYTKD